ncbi:major facilitator superfamily domain-containing protein [Tricharina praecox]|uniref:major facilitator superfamily domain-containing protein n=1 Tax=Tricharina praecox TaxID=43433 RepID=UPI0022204CBB|nr:major facilitator superfamily domain-containing protein [Tricharina praecox]KAI5854973.1 major facilitator superfamily domain-containing protein [Tricharina praecox]
MPAHSEDTPSQTPGQLESSDLEVGSPEKLDGNLFNEQTHYVPPRTIIKIFLACASVDMVALMDQTSLAASMTIISSSLNAGRQASWIANAYFITSTSFQLLYGRLSDVWSRKLVLLAGLLIFFLGSLAASLAQNAMQLIVFRAFTGIGGGGLATVAQIIVSDVVTLRERGKYQGILGAVVALSNGVGPVLGGALASQSEDSWRWIFRLNMPLSVICALCCIFFMPLRKVEGSWKKKLAAIDFIGAALTLAGSALIILGLTWAGSEYPWDSPYVISTIVAGVAVSAIFLLWQWKGSTFPLMPLHIFKQTIVIGGCFTMFVNGWNFIVQIYYIPTFYQLAYGYSAVKSGALLLPLVLVQTFSSTISGLIVTWTGRYRELILVGWIVWAIGLGLFSTLDETSGLGKQIGYALLTGLGVGHTLQPALIALQAGVERKDMAVVTGTRNFLRNLGGTLGLALAGTILNNTIRSRLAPLGYDDTAIGHILDAPTLVLSRGEDDETRIAVLAAYQRGFRVIFLVGASLAALAFFVALATIKQINLDRDDDEALKKEAARVLAEKKKRKEGEASETNTM